MRSPLLPQQMGGSGPGLGAILTARVVGGGHNPPWGGGGGRRGRRGKGRIKKGVRYNEGEEEEGKNQWKEKLEKESKARKKRKQGRERR